MGFFKGVPLEPASFANPFLTRWMFEPESKKANSCFAFLLTVILWISVSAKTSLAALISFQVGASSKHWGPLVSANWVQRTWKGSGALLVGCCIVWLYPGQLAVANWSSLRMLQCQLLDPWRIVFFYLATACLLTWVLEPGTVLALVVLSSVQTHNITTSNLNLVGSFHNRYLYKLRTVLESISIMLPAL